MGRRILVILGVICLVAGLSLAKDQGVEGKANGIEKAGTKVEDKASGIKKAGTKEALEYRMAQEKKVGEYKKQQKTENEAFMKSLSNMTPEQKKAAIVEHRKAQQQKKKAFREKLRDENKAFRKAENAKKQLNVNIQNDKVTPTAPVV